MKWTTTREARMFADMFETAARIVAGEYYTYNEILRRHLPVNPGRPWFRNQYGKYRIHGAIWDMMMQYRPDDWHQLMLEWPHKAETDPSRLAYTRDERAGEADRQTVTSIGKYLTRHFPDAPDHKIGRAHV